MLAQVETLKQQNFELTCYRVDVIRCLKTIAFEHNHRDISLYQDLAKSLMESLAENQELAEIRAQAVLNAFDSIFGQFDFGQYHAKLGLLDDIESLFIQYAATLRQGGE